MKDIDLSDYHGIEDGYVNEAYLVRASLWCQLSSLLVASSYAFLLYTCLSYIYTQNTFDSFFLWLTVVVSAVLLLAHLLVLFKVELARKVVVLHSFVLLFAVPIGTILAFVLYKNYKGKVFKKA